jgi:phage terminase large subunit-like protein
MPTKTAQLTAGLLDACDAEQLFGVTLTPLQRRLLEQVEAGGLLHVWALGRRSGKTLLAALVALWTCLLRPELREHIRQRERLYAVAVATNIRQARIFVAQAHSVVESSPLLAGVVESATEDEIRFANRTVLSAFPCTSRGGRGWPIACVLLDEAAHQLDTDGNQAAEPVYRALVPSTAQFGNDARVIVASTPFGIDGFFSDLFHSIEKGHLDGAVCAQAATLDMRPDFPATALDLEQRRDPEGFRAEYGAEFVAAGGAFLDANMIAAAVQRKEELCPGEVDDPEAAIDLGFVSDSTGLAIVGRDRDNPDRQRLVLARAWKPDLGPLGFGPTLDNVADVCLEHGVRHLFADQFSSQAAVEHLARRGIRATVVPTTAASKSEAFASLKTRIYGGGLELYEQPELLAELNRLETVTTPGQATVRIRRLGSSHGDLATAVALASAHVRTGMRVRGWSYAKGNIADYVYVGADPYLGAGV